MLDKTKKNPRRPKTEVPDQLAKSWLLVHSFEREVQRAEVKERSKKRNPVKREVKK